MKILLSLLSFAFWGFAGLLFWLDQQGTIQQPLWVITSPVWGLFLFIVVSFVWADRKSKAK